MNYDRKLKHISEMKGWPDQRRIESNQAPSGDHPGGETAKVIEKKFERQIKNDQLTAPRENICPGEE